MSDQSGSADRGPVSSGGGARLSRQDLERAVQQALARLPHDHPIHRPILVGIIAYPEGGKVQIHDIQAGPQG